eukprot:jgi/Botrbrau1/14235/Bobra.0099s0010.1
MLPLWCFQHMLLRSSTVLRRILHLVSNVDERVSNRKKHSRPILRSPLTFSSISASTWRGPPPPLFNVLSHSSPFVLQSSSRPLEELPPFPARSRTLVAVLM